MIFAMEKLERVKGIEPSYSAWKAAALPLSYTRLVAINYHAGPAVSTVMRRTRTSPDIAGKSPDIGLEGTRRPPAFPLTSCDSRLILLFPLTEKGGDPVSFTKRCHLAGIAR
jgi:hypothetical protein